MDLPWVGAGFRRVSDKVNEIELVILVRPEFADAMDPGEVPCGPGETTTSPNDVELFGRGYIEVPKCAENCVGGQPGMPGNFMAAPAGAPSGGIAPIYTPGQTGMRPNASPRMATGNQPGRTAMAPNAYRGSNRYGQQHPAIRSAKAPSKGSATLIGPLGYDELR
jgi:pilus assembly protein CpaC